MWIRSTAPTAVFLASTCFASFAAAPRRVQAQTPTGEPVSFQIHSEELSETFAEVAERVSPSVVSLKIEARRASGFGRSRLAEGGGSGVIISREGHILTNNHVVRHATRITAHLRDGRQFPGSVIGTDPATDLAVVKIDGTRLSPASFGSSGEARVGQIVMAVGSPFGLDYTVTTGVLSAKGRGIGANEIEDYLQTDASINPGNSGGPLLDLTGHVLGINTMIVGRGTGIGFAIPSDLAQHVAQQIIERGEVRRAWVGVSFQELTSELAEHFDIDRGALIGHAISEGPAARAGLRAGDVIIAVNDQEVVEGRDLLRQVLRTDVGESLRVTYVRDGSERSSLIRTMERPGAETGRQTSRLQTRRSSGMGLSYSTSDGAVVIRSVQAGSPGDRAGLRPGDRLVEADRRPVRSNGDVGTALADDGKALLYVERREGGFFTVLRRDP